MDRSTPLFGWSIDMGEPSEGRARKKLKDNVPRVVILTALGDEVEAVRESFTLHGYIERRRNSLPPLSYSVFEAPGRWRCIVSNANASGKVDAAIAATILCLRHNPDLFLLVGIAGAIRNRFRENSVKLGDVLIAEKIIDMKLKKIHDFDEIYFGGIPNVPVDQDVLNLVATAINKDWAQHIPRRVLLGRRDPQVHFGNMLSSEAVIAAWDSSALDLIRFHEPLGVEMEGGAVSRAISTCSQKTRFLMIRGVSDFANGWKNDDQLHGRELAAASAAALAVSVVDEYRLISVRRGKGNKVLR